MCDRGRRGSIHLYLCGWLRWRRLQPHRDGYSKGELFWRDYQGKSYTLSNPFSSSFPQDPAILTPVRTMAHARSSLRLDEETFSTSTSASASPASRECTARSVSYFCMWLMILSCFSCPVHIYSYTFTITIFEFYSQVSIIPFVLSCQFLTRYLAI